ncbi:MAG: hypothetical protein ABIK15_06060 [Pseudomonadota bacterium]
MNAILRINKIQIELGYKELECICDCLEDCQKNKAVFHELAKLNCVDIKVSVACRKTIHPGTIKILLEDTDIEVLRMVVNNSHIKSYMRTQDFEHLLSTGDSIIFKDVADDLEFYVEEIGIDLLWLCNELITRGDLSVKHTLVENDCVPIEVLKKLTQDEDINIRETAKETLCRIIEDKE